jgi:outer membrane protein insertion porin family
MRAIARTVRRPFGPSLGVAIGLLLHAPTIPAEPSRALELEPAPDLSAYATRSLASVQVETEGQLWPERIHIHTVRPGDPATPEVARRAIEELTKTGRFAEIRASFSTSPNGILLILRARPRRIVSRIVFEGNPLEPTEAERALGIAVGQDTTAAGLEEARAALTALHHASGYSQARVAIVPEATDDPMRVLLRVQIESGPPDRVTRRQFLLAPFPPHPELRRSLAYFRLGEGDRIDQNLLRTAAERLTDQLVSAGFYEAAVETEVTAKRELLVRVNSGPRFQVRIEGQQTFDARTLEAALGLAEKREASPELAETSLKEFYARYGFYDTRISVQRIERKSGTEGEIRVFVNEGEPLKIVSRTYPCLGGVRRNGEIDREVDGVLREHFAEPHLIGPPEGEALSATTEGRALGSSREPLTLDPYARYTEKAYAAVREHLEHLLQAEGYLSARVQPEIVSRRACAPGTQPDVCLPLGKRPSAPTSCGALPGSATASEPSISCKPGPQVRCEPNAELVLPIQPGPLTILTDITIEGNQVFAASELRKTLGLRLESPVRRAELDQAITRVRDLYAEAAYAFAEVESDLDVSEDGTRARLLVRVAERKPVRVARIVIQGSDRTRIGLIRGRVALSVGGLYRTSLVRQTQDQVDSLGTFTSVSVSLEDPRVPAREKTVVIRVSERLPQYLDLKAGLSSGDGFRIGFEYGHRNLGREAVQLILRSQLGLRPPFLIVEPDVRARYQDLKLVELLERRNSISVTIPEVGLGPKYRFAVEALDLRDNQRDYAQVRDALSTRLLLRASRAWNFSLSASVERNDISLFALLPGSDLAGEDARKELERILKETPYLRFPEGISIAIAQELAATWDQRDRPLSPSKGTILGATVEHVTAIPVNATQPCDAREVHLFEPACSELLRLSGRASVHIPLKKGFVLALGLRAGTIVHLTADSSTYPDRLFFMGGFDTLRGFPQDSLVPENIAASLLKPGSDLTIDKVVLRGGDVFWNPRAELRIPLGGALETALFLDSGNVWSTAAHFDAFALRYTIGTGIRYQTPVGPLVFDYGFNVDRVMDALFPDRPNQRTWEALGAFHFSIGYF